MDAVSDDALIGRKVARYRIVELIGAGGMGKVYRARDERLGRDVAIKVLIPSPGDHPLRDPNLADEARALSRLSHHHVAAIYDLLTESGQDFIVMELVLGETLKEIVDRGPLPFAEVIRLGRQMAEGLGAAHAADLVHRDIKPANLKMTSSGDLKILDFGLARLMPGAAVVDLTTSTQLEMRAGTMPYMAPEQLRGERADARSDIFSAGAVLYEMATGQMAFPQKSFVDLVEAVLHDDPLVPSRINPLVPRQFNRVVRKAMAKRPARRYQTAMALGDALQRLDAERGRVAASIYGDWLARWLAGL